MFWWLDYMIKGKCSFILVRIIAKLFTPTALLDDWSLVDFHAVSLISQLGILSWSPGRFSREFLRVFQKKKIKRNKTSLRNCIIIFWKLVSPSLQPSQLHHSALPTNPHNLFHHWLEITVFKTMIYLSQFFLIRTRDLENCIVQQSFHSTCLNGNYLKAKKIQLLINSLQVSKHYSLNLKCCGI